MTEWDDYQWNAFLDGVEIRRLDIVAAARRRGEAQRARRRDTYRRWALSAALSAPVVLLMVLVGHTGR